MSNGREFPQQLRVQQSVSSTAKYTWREKIVLCNFQEIKTIFQISTHILAQIIFYDVFIIPFETQHSLGQANFLHHE